MSTVLTRWIARLAVRRSLLKAATARLTAAERGLAWATKNGRASVTERRLAVAELRKLVAKRKADVAFAERVVARHRKGADRPSEEVVRVIADFEGGQSRDGLFHPYWDAYGNVWTIGYGHTGGVSASSRPLTKAQAQALLLSDLTKEYAPHVARVADALGLKLTQNEFDALTSAVYNLGWGVLDKGRTLGDALRSNGLVRRKRAADAFLVYTKDANGHELAGLVRRRKAERALWLGLS